MHYFNHYSAPIIVALLLLAGGAVIKRRGSPTRDWFILGGTAVACVAGWLVLRPVASNTGTGTGQPVLLEVQSPYCLGCVALKPAVDRLEHELRGRLVVHRVDIQSAAGRALVGKYGIEFTPTLIFLDAAGKEQWREVGGVDAVAVRRLVNEAR